MHTRSIFIGTLTALTLLAAGCTKEVCELKSSRIEVDVTFSGFDRSAAVTLEVDSTVLGPPASEYSPDYYSRRVGTMQFPASARDGEERFVFDPGAYIGGLGGTEDGFYYVLVMRVWDGAGVLLAEGRFELIDAAPSGCYLARSMTVSGERTCVDHAEGDACVGANGASAVCQDAGGALSCLASNCGDGYVDLGRGELCEPGMTAGVQCDPGNCLPKPVEVTLHEGGPRWFRVDDAGGSVPPARAHAAAVRIVEVGTDAVLMFGGATRDATGDLVYLDDSWLFFGTEWMGVAPSVRPPPRANHALAWDPVNEVAVLFGGDQEDPGVAGYEQFGDTWIYTPSMGWAQGAPSQAPSARTGAAMAYDPGSQQVVLYGGRAGNTVMDDTWVYDVASDTWTEQTASGQPRYDHTITYVPELGGLVMYGGRSGNTASATLYEDFMIYASGSWQAVGGSAAPVGRTSHGAAYVPDVSLLVVFGGWDRARDDDNYGSWLQDTWECPADAGLVCQNHSSADAPPGRKGHVMAELGGRVYVFGGVRRDDTGGDDQYLDDTWVLETPGPERPDPVLNATLKDVLAEETLVQGFYDVSVPPDERDTLPLEAVGSLLLADLDGDSLEELAVGLPGGHESGSVDLCGKVVVKDHQLFDQTLGETRNDFLTLLGRSGVGESSWFGASLASADINGDGVRDLVVGAPMGDDGTGGMYVTFGGDDHSIPIVPTDSYTIQVQRTSDVDKYFAFLGNGDAYSDQPHHLGYQVAAADFDGDGFADVVTSAPSEQAGGTSRSSVYAFAGPGTLWMTGSYPLRADEAADLVVTTAAAGLQLGISLAAEDVDGDGFPDLIIGSASYDPPSAQPQFGAVAVVFGGEDFFDRWAQPVLAEELDAPRGLWLTAANGSSPIAGIGGTVGAADLDGDGAADLAAALGRPSRDALTPDSVALVPGSSIASYREGGDITELTARLTVLHGPPGSGFGAHVGVGHANGDRVPDLFIGAPYEPGPAPEGLLERPEAGALYVLLGSRLADYWSAMAVSVDDLIDWDVSGAGDPIPMPLIIVRGAQAHGFFGTATASNGHIAQQDPSDPHAYTLVFQPGWLDGLEPAKRNRGRVWTLYLPALLPCGAEPLCPLDIGPAQ